MYETCRFWKSAYTSSPKTAKFARLCFSNVLSSAAAEKVSLQYKEIMNSMLTGDPKLTIKQVVYFLLSVVTGKSVLCVCVMISWSYNCCQCMISYDILADNFNASNSSLKFVIVSHDASNDRSQDVK